MTGSFRTPPRDPRRRVLRLGRRRRSGQGWGIDPSRGGMRIYEPMRRAEPGLLHPLRRHDLRRQPDPAGGRARRRDGLAQPRHAGQGQGRRDARRVPRQLPLQPARRAPPRASTPRCRWSCSGTTTRCSTTGTPARCHRRRALHGEERGPARGPGEAGLLRVPADPPAGRGPGADLPLVRLRPVARGLRPRPAELPRPEHRQPAGEAGRRDARFLGRRAAARGCKERAAGELARRGRSSPATCRSAWSCPTARGASRRWPTATPARRSAASWRSPTCSRFLRDQRVRNVVWLTADVHYAAAHHYDPERARFHGLRPLLGVRGRPAARRDVPAHAARRHVRARRCSSSGSVPPDMKPNRPPSEGLQFFGRGADRRGDGGVDRQPARPRRPAALLGRPPPRALKVPARHVCVAARLAVEEDLALHGGSPRSGRSRGRRRAPGANRRASRTASPRLGHETASPPSSFTVQPASASITWKTAAGLWTLRSIISGGLLSRRSVSVPTAQPRPSKK